MSSQILGIPPIMGWFWFCENVNCCNMSVICNNLFIFAVYYNYFATKDKYITINNTFMRRSVKKPKNFCTNNYRNTNSTKPHPNQHMQQIRFHTSHQMHYYFHLLFLLDRICLHKLPIQLGYMVVLLKPECS